MNKALLTQKIKNKILLNGFTAVGITKPEQLDKEAKFLEKWLKNNLNGKMYYMEKNFDLRINPKKIFPEAKSIIMVLKNYYQEDLMKNKPKFSIYAYGNDYHWVIKQQLREILEELKKDIGNFSYKVFTDSAPIMEKALARRAGLGWISKNTNLITKQKGSFHFIATILLDIPLDYDSPMDKDFCGKCNKCIEACPTGALSPFVLDATKCISYLTIELKDEIPEEFTKKLQGWAFGCDICQRVCPWNRFATRHSEELFEPKTFITDFFPEDWNKLSGKQYKKMVKTSPISRVKKQKLLDNLQKAQKSLKITV